MSEALVIRPNAPNPINRLPNLRESRKILGAQTGQTQLNRIRRGQVGTKASVPPIAYTLMGHGNETAEYKIVPPGCILVVQASSGNTVSATTGVENTLKLLDDRNRRYVLDPLNNKREIYRLFGPVTIFTEGDLYPEFSYSLLSYYNDLELEDERGRLGRYAAFKTSGATRILPAVPVNPLLTQSLENDYRVLNQMLDNEMVPDVPQVQTGAIKIRLINEDFLKIPMLLVGGRTLNLKKIRETDPNRIAEMFKTTPTELHPEAEAVIRRLNLSYLFKFSDALSDVKLSSVHAYIKRDLEDFKLIRPRPTLVDMDVRDYIQMFLVDDLLDLTQEGLFKKGGPGVYYNFICRSRGASTTNPFKLKASNLQRISEAATHRGEFIRNVLKGGARRQTRSRSLHQSFY